MSDLGRRKAGTLPFYCAGMIIPDSKIVEQDALAKPHIVCENCSKIRKATQEIAQDADNAIIGLAHKQDDFWSVIEISHYQTGRDLLNSLTDGCHMCSLLMDHLLESDGSSGDYFTSLNVDKRVEHIIDSKITVELWLPVDKTVSWEYVHIVTTSSLSAEKRSKRIRFGPSINETKPNNIHEQALFSVSTSSNPSLTWAKDMLKNCINSHAECLTISNRPGYLPTRIIYVGLNGDPLEPKLVISKEHDISAPYAALSYCWGGSWPCSLVKAKVDDYQKSIPINILPQTLRDSMLVTRELGLSYLWIDALTIIQDDILDWERESRSMADVYRNASVTIAGLSSANSDHGLFGLKNPLIYQPCWLADLADGSGIFALPAINGFDESHAQAMPLSSRGWTFQERVLGARILYFGETVVWECCEDMVIDLFHCRDEENWENRKNWPSLASKSLHRKLKAAAVSSNVFAESLDLWHDVVERYSRTILTVASDRLIAIIGIAKLIESYTKLRFIAGLWMPFSVDQLSWSIQDTVPDITNLAPSWSWLNTGKAITFHALRLRAEYYTASIIDLNVISKAPSGSIDHLPLGGKLYIKAALLRFISFSPDNNDQDGDTLEIESLPPVEIGWFYWDQDVQKHLPLIVRGEKASKFRLLMLRWGLHLSGPRWLFQGVVLVASLAVPGAYERRGLLEITTQIEGNSQPNFWAEELVLV